MVFVTVDEDRVQLNNLTGSVIQAFPGSVIYQYSDPMYAMISMIDREFDAALISAGVLRGIGWQMLARLHRERPELQVIVLSDDELLRGSALEFGAEDYLIRPITGQKLRDALCAM